MRRVKAAVLRRLRTWYTDLTPDQQAALQLVRAAAQLAHFELRVLGVLLALYTVAVVAFAVWGLA